MNSRYFESNNYEQLVEWWSFWRFTPPSITNLPKTGVIVNNDGIDVASGFLYLTNSDMCWIEFIVSNPNVKDKKVRENCINECINQLCHIAKEMGYRVAYTSLKNENLQKKYLSCGFIEGGKSRNEYIKIL